MKKISVKLVFGVVFVLLFSVNIIYQNFIYTNLASNEAQIINNKIVKNAEKLSNDQLKKNGYMNLDRLKKIYIEKQQYLKALNIVEIISSENMTLDNIYSIINLSEESLDFEKARQYIEKGFVLMENVQKKAAFLRLGEYELIDGSIDKSIEYIYDAIEIDDLDKNSSDYSNNISFLNKRIELLESVKDGMESSDPSDVYNAYKKIIESDDIFYSPGVCKALVSKYKKEYNDTSKYEDLRMTYENTYEN